LYPLSVCCLDFLVGVAQLLHVVMIAKYYRKSLAFGMPGILLQQGWLVLIVVLSLKDGSPLKPFPEWVGTLFEICFFFGSILWLVGMCYYAMAKGYHATIGIILGFFFWMGLFILWVFPDKAEDENHRSAYTPEPN
jgi:hypothetical protein